jgi:membrane carboxypeptidase/penicillin-binding protein
VSVRRALELSLNAATVRIAETVGLPAVVETARTLGVGDHASPNPSVALGALDVTPLELARAYAAFANGGIRPPRPTTIGAISYRDGTGAPAAPEPPVQAMTPAEAYVMTSLLEGVITAGTGNAARSYDLPAAIAGKTGTTNDGRDAWFVGYSPHLLALVWVGFDSGEAHGLSGSRAALPIWADFMQQASQLLPPSDFPVPPGVVFADIDATNGKLAGRYCPVIVRETFLAGTEPAPCDEHPGVVDQVVEWWNQVTDWFRR